MDYFWLWIALAFVAGTIFGFIVLYLCFKDDIDDADRPTVRRSNPHNI